MTNANTPDNRNDTQVPASQVHNATQDTADESKGHQASAEQQAEEKKRANARTEAEAQSIDGKAGQSQKSSHDHMGHVKAGTHEGAGGGAKSQRHH